MKKVYFLLLAIPILFFTLLYLSLWWFLAATATVMLFIAYQLYADRLSSAKSRNEVLEVELEDLHTRLETAVVREQKTNKEAEKVRHLKQQLLSVISHEIRTPMNGILGTSILLADTGLTTEQKDHVQTIRSCSENLLTTVNTLLANNILDFSKLHQEGNKLELKDFDVRDLVEEVLDLFASACHKKNIEIFYEINEDVPDHIIGDNKRIRQVLINLVENAVKFTEKGEIRVSIYYILPAAAGYPPDLKIEVCDTGAGMAKETTQQLFTGIPVRASQSENENQGLGLVVCKKLVEVMGGQLDVNSVEGKGSCFSFRLPFTPSLNGKRSNAHLALVNFEGRKILVIESNPTLRKVLTKQLALLKMDATGIPDLNHLEAGLNPDIVLSGELNKEQVEKIRNAYPATRLICMQNAEKSSQVIPGGFDAAIAKPVRRHILIDKMQSLLQERLQKSSLIEPEINENFASQFPLRILIAEDNPINQKIAVKILAKLGYQTDVAADGKEALELVGNDTYDVILMDVQMPEMNGLEATRMMRICLEVQPVIIALTANAMQGDRDECMQAGMDDYMSKPIDMGELTSRLRKWSQVIRDKKRA